MTPERWKQIEAIFEQALELKANERAAFVQKSCTGDEELRREVESLLESHASAGGFIDDRSLFISEVDLNDDDGIVPPGQLIGPYRITREIGRGGMGTVYLAERADQQYEKQVAIKLIKRGMDTDSVLRHFRNERQILASFDHPNIARLFDGGTTKDGLPYFVMEYVEGIAIDRYCDEERLSINERLKLFLQVCAAVSYAHRHTVIHRDIKPSNVLVTSDGVPKLLDFGIAKILQSGDGAEGFVTATGIRPMTPEYASPEQVRGESVTTANDVYSLGVVLYELLTGTSPYRLTTHGPREIERAISEQAPAKPSTVPADDNRKSVRAGLAFANRKSLKGDLDNILLMALRKEPARRYQLVENFADDIRRHLDSRPVLARRDTLTYRGRKFVQRNRVTTAAACIILVSLVAGLIATAWQAHRATVQKARAERRFNDVRQLAHSVLFDYHDAIKGLPGATAVRERLVKDALTYLDRLTSEASGDHALQRELAAAYERVGDVRGEIYSASLGDMAGALDSYQKALRIREALVAADPRDGNNYRDLAESYTKIGSQLQDTANASRGLEYLRKACALYRQLASEHAASPEIIDWLARAHNELGVALLGWGDPAGALENHNEALRIRKDLLARDPQNELHRRHLAITYWDIGQALLLRGDINAALEANGIAMQLSAALLAENPTSSRDRRRLAISYQTDGDCRALTGDTAGALDSFRKKLQLDEQSLTADPVDAQAHGDIGFSCARIGELLEVKGDYAEALFYERKALELYQKLSADSPQDVHARYRTAVVGATAAKLEAWLADREQALGGCATVLKVLKELPEDQANNLYSGLRGQAYLHVGAAQAALAAAKELTATQQHEYWRAARDLYRRSLDIWQDMQKRGSLTVELSTKLQEARRGLDKCDAVLAEKTTRR